MYQCIDEIYEWERGGNNNYMLDFNNNQRTGIHHSELIGNW